MHFDYGKEKNAEVLNDEKKREEFEKEMKLKIAKEMNIPFEEVEIASITEGSIKLTFVTKT